jgi:2-oxo-3-hexenedioate decarboxylase
VPLHQLIHPRAEPEIAFLIGRRLEGPVTAAGVPGRDDSMIAAVEIMDTRYCDRFRLPDSVADNAGAARVVLGARPARPQRSAICGCWAVCSAPVARLSTPARAAR